MGRKSVNLLFILMVITTMTKVLAHGSDTDHDLKDVIPCLDTRSLHVSVLDKGGYLDDSTDTILRRLSQTSKAVLDTFAIPYEEKEHCQDDNFVLILFYAEEASDNAGNTFFNYISSVQMGRAPDEIEAETLLVDSHFDAFYSAFYSTESNIAPFYVALPSINEGMLENLAVAWWEDNPIVVKPSLMMPILIGLGLAFSTSFLTFFLLRRQKRRVLSLS